MEEQLFTVSRQDSDVTVHNLCTTADSDEGSASSEADDVRPCTRPVQSSGRWLQACTPKLNGRTLRRALTPRMPKFRGGAITRAAKGCLPCCLSEPKVSDPDSPKRGDSHCNARGPRGMGDMTQRPALGNGDFLEPDVWDEPLDLQQVHGLATASSTQPGHSRLTRTVLHEADRLLCDDTSQDLAASLCQLTGATKVTHDAGFGIVGKDTLTRTITDEASKLLGDDTSQELAAAVSALCGLAGDTQADVDTTFDSSSDASASPSSHSADTAGDAATEVTCSPSRAVSAPSALGDSARTHAGNRDPAAEKCKQTSEEEVQAVSAKPRAASRGRPPAGRPPPPRRAHSEVLRGKSPGERSLPDWCGPSPSPNWKAERVVNWQPIRHVGRWEGSVWQMVNTRMHENGFTPLPDELLNKAFMRNVEDPTTPRRQRSTSQPRSLKRRLSQQAALTADLLHAQLNRRGIERPSQLAWVTGFPCITEATRELPEDVLETLQGLLRAAVGEEGKLLKTEDECDELRMAPAEAFLQTLLTEAGPLRLLRPRVDLALSIAQFPAEVAALESEFCMGLTAANGILKSAAIPVLLEGVLLLGNYVNSGSKVLSGAVGVTLESLTKLAHTRCLPQQGVEAAAQPHRIGCNASLQDRAHQGNALVLLVQHLQQTRPGFVEVLRRDLEGACAASDLEPEAMACQVTSFGSRLLKVRECLEGGGPCATIVGEGSREVSLPAALTEERLRCFLDGAASRLEAVEQLSKEFNEATAALRRWFAESGGTGFRAMMRCFASLHKALPAPPKPVALGALPKRSPARHLGQPAAILQRARSAPVPAVARSSAAAAQVRQKSAPPRYCSIESREKQHTEAPAADQRRERQERVSTPRAKLEQTRRQCVVTQPSQPHSGKKLRPLPSPREVRGVQRPLDYTAAAAPGKQSTEIVAQGAPSDVQVKPCLPPTEPSKEDKQNPETVAKESTSLVQEKTCTSQTENRKSKLAPLPSVKLSPLPSLPLQQGPPKKTEDTERIESIRSALKRVAKSLGSENTKGASLKAEVENLRHEMTSMKKSCEEVLTHGVLSDSARTYQGASDLPTEMRPRATSKAKLQPPVRLASLDVTSASSSATSVLQNSCAADKSKSEAHQVSVALPLAFSDAVLANREGRPAQLACSIASPVEVALPPEFGVQEVPVHGAADAAPSTDSCNSIAETTTQAPLNASCFSASPQVVKQVSLPLEFSMPHLRAMPCQ